MTNMSKKVGIAGMVVVFVVTMCFSMVILPSKVYAAILNVGPGQTYTTIQAAIDAASSGDTIIVAAGTYHEGLVINKSLTLEGENRDTTFIDGTGVSYGVETHYDYGICITAPSGVKICNFTIQNFSIVDSRGGNPAGISFKSIPSQTDMEVSNVTVKNNLEVGVRIGLGPGHVSGSNFSDIVLENNNNDAAGDWLHKGVGLWLSYSSNNVFTNITINGHHGVGIYNSDQSNGNSFTIIDCNGNTRGIYFFDSSTNTVTDSVIKNNQKGITLWTSGEVGYECNNNKINHSNIVGNSDYGIKNVNAGIFDATNNWWGDNSGPSGGFADPVTGTIANGTGNAVVSENVHFDPWTTRAAPPPPPEEEEAKPKPKKEKPKPKPWERTDIGYYEKTDTGFTTIFYSRFFSRPPDQAGLDSWVTWLESGAITGADLVKGFIFGEECQAKISDYTDEEFITFLYRVLFNRATEDYGFNAWLARMNAGMTREEVVDGFTHSEEFVNLCKEFGIIPYEGYISTTE